MKNNHNMNLIRKINRLLLQNGQPKLGGKAYAVESKKPNGKGGNTDE